MAAPLTPDVCVIGGGPAGIALALGAAAEGVSVVVCEKAALGGANLARGAIPLQALSAAAAVYEALRRGPAMGITGAPLQVSFPKVREHMAGVSQALAAAVTAERLALQGVTVIPAAARFTDRSTVVAGAATIRARRFVLAVGAAATPPPLPGLADVDVLSAEELFALRTRPSHLLVLGATPYGLAVAQAHARLGIDATVIDEGPTLPGEDAELASLLVACLGAEGVRVRSSVKVQSVARRRGGIRFILGGEGGDTAVDGSHIFVAGGRQPLVDDLGLEAAGIAHNAHGIVVGPNLRTANRRVYAVGDAVAGPASVARAEREARRVLRAILFRLPVGYDPSAVPRVVPTDPELASVGLGEAEARGRRGVRIVRYPYVENARALVDRLPEGVIKLVVGRGGAILGAAAVGRDASEAIALWSLAMGRRLTLADMRAFASPYPSRADLSRAVAALDAGLTSPWRRRIISLLRKFG